MSPPLFVLQASNPGIQQDIASERSDAMAAWQSSTSNSGICRRIRVGDGIQRTSETVSLCGVVCPVNTRLSRNKQHSLHFDGVGGFQHPGHPLSSPDQATSDWDFACRLCSSRLSRAWMKEK